MTSERSRRRFLVSCTPAVALIAGCDQPGRSGDRSTRSTGDATETTADTGDEGAVTGESDEMPGTDSTPTATPELDLSEANVVDVAVESVGDGQYHNDDGEDGHANWWQVETLDGEQLGRRELLHAHSTAPFTRSETIEVPVETGCVVVRGHDQIHGYGGQAMVVAIDGGATQTLQQGNDRTSVPASSCPA